MIKRSFSLLAFLAAAIAAGCAGANGPVQIGQQAPRFSLSDRRGTEFSLETPRANPLVVIFPHMEQRGAGRAWFRSIRAESLDCQCIIIASMPSGGRGGRGGGPGGGGPGGGGGMGPGGGGGMPPGPPPDGGGMGSSGGQGRPSRDGSGRPGDDERDSTFTMLMDRSGSVTKAWIGEDANQTAVIVVSTDNVVRHVAWGAPNAIVLGELVNVVNQLNSGETQSTTDEAGESTE